MFYFVCNLNLGQKSELKGFVAPLEIEKDRHRVAQNLSEEAMLIMPEIFNFDLGDLKSLGQLRADGCD